MASVSGRWGNQGGRTIAQLRFTAAGQDSGPIGYHELGLGWKEFLFQLCGPGTGFAITVYGTIHIPTANGDINPLTGLPFAEWFVLPAPSTEASAQWQNPVRPGPTNSALSVKVPIIAFRAVSTAFVGSPITGDVELYAFVVS